MLTEATLGGVRPIGFRWGKPRTYLLGSYVGFRGLRIIPLLRRCARSVHQRLGSDSHAHFRCLIASDWRGAPRRRFASTGAMCFGATRPARTSTWRVSLRRAKWDAWFYRPIRT